MKRVEDAPGTATDPDLAQTVMQRAPRDVAGQVLGRALSLGISLISTLTIVRALGVEDFGKWATITAVAQVVGYLADLGLQQTTIRQAASHPEMESRLLGTALVLRLGITPLVAVVCAAIMVLIATDAEMREAGLLVSSTLIILAPGIVAIIFQIRVENHMVVLIQNVSAVCWLGLVLVLSWSDASLLAYAGAFVVLSVITAGQQVVLALRRATVSFAGVRTEARPLLRAAVPLGLGSLLALMYGRLDQVLVLQLAGERDASLYGAAYRIFDQAQFVPLAVATTLLPILAAAYRRGDAATIDRLIGVGSSALVFVALPLFVLALVAGDSLLTLLFGSEFAEAGTAFAVLAGTFMLACLSHVFGSLLIARHRQVYYLRTSAAALVVNVVLNLVLVPEYGFVAAAWATLVTQAVVLGLYVAVSPGSFVAVCRERLVRAAVIAGAAMAAVTWICLEPLNLPTAPAAACASLTYLYLAVRLSDVSLSGVLGLVLRGGSVEPEAVP